MTCEYTSRNTDLTISVADCPEGWYSETAGVGETGFIIQRATTAAFVVTNTDMHGAVHSDTEDD